MTVFIALAVLTVSTGTGVSDALINNGSLGILALVAISAAGILYRGMSAALELERKRVDELTAELAKANASMQAMSTGVLAEATRAIGEALTVTRDRR